MSTLEQRARNAALRKQMAFDRVAEARASRFLQFQNKNLVNDRKRKAAYGDTPGRADRDLSNSDRSKLISEARQIVEENPLAAALLVRHLDYVVGPGYMLSARSSDNRFNSAVEAAWAEHENNLDLRGMSSFGELLRIIQARHIVDGDVFVYLADSNQLSIIEADRCYANTNSTNPHHPGIDYDPITGRPLSFWFGRRAQYAEAQSGIESKPYSPESVIFYMHNLDCRAERERGVSAFLQLINALKDIDENLEAMDIKAKNEAFIGIAFKTEPPDENGGSLFSGFENTESKPDDEPRAHVKMKPGMNLDLGPGESAEVIESKSPHGNYVDYIRFRMRTVGLTLGFPLEFLFLDASQTNYSGLMMLAQMARACIRRHQAALSRVASKIYLRWLASFVKNNSGIPVDYMRHGWGKPGVGFVDIGKETAAFISLINANLATRQQVLAWMGEGADFADVADQASKEQDYMNDLGLAYEIGKPGAVIANTGDDGSINDEDEDEGLDSWLK